MIWPFSWFRDLREEQAHASALASANAEEIAEQRREVTALREVVQQTREVVKQTLARKDLFQHQEFLKLHRRGLMKNISDGEGGNTWVIDEEKLDTLLKK